MQISGYSSAAMLAQQFSGMQQKANTVKMQDFTKLMQNTNAAAQATGQIDEAAATQEVSEVDEMAAFKQEIYKELAEIDSMTAASVLTNSIHITEDGFQRMKDDPEYRKEIMDWLRADARDSHKVPFDCHVTTTITSAGATSYGISDTATTPQWVNSKAEGAFYRSDRRTEQRKRNNEYVTEERLKRELMQKMILEKSIDRKEQLQALDQKIFDQKVAQHYLLGMQGYPVGMQNSKSWSI